MKNLIHKKIKYISIIIGLLGLIPYGLPLVEKYDLDGIFVYKLDKNIFQ